MTALLNKLTETSSNESAGDPLAGILASLRLTGGIAADADVSGDWCLTCKVEDEQRTSYLPAASEVVSFHFVRSGHFFAQVDGEPEIELTAGTMALFPRNDRHLLYSRAGLPPVDAHELLEGEAPEPGTIRIEGEGERSRFYCGFLGIAPEHRPLLESLPRAMKLCGSELFDKDWMESSIELLNNSQAAREIAARLAELFFVKALHGYLEGMPAEAKGLIAGIHDPAVGKALAIIHNRYLEPLELDYLARESGVSVAVLRQRFVEILGTPPMRYTARWRMRVAASLLREGKQNNANIAHAVGFGSEAAFNRAFKREFGVPPATWRRQIEEA